MLSLLHTGRGRGGADDTPRCNDVTPNVENHVAYAIILSPSNHTRMLLEVFECTKLWSSVPIQYSI